MTMNCTMKIWHLMGRSAIALAAAAATPMVLAAGDLAGGPSKNQIDLHPPATRIASDVLGLHNFMMILCVVIFLAVFGVMFYSILKHRKSLGHKAAHFHESVAVEIAWTVVPFVIVVVMGLAATKTVVAMKDTSNADLTIKTTGYQWKWGYDYLKGEGEGIGFLSTLDVAQRQMSDAGKPAGDDYLLKVDNPLVVPVDKKIRIITTAADVIHSWMVPAFAVKQDAIPGFVRDAWFRAEKTGDFYGQCVELCGKEHAYMPIHVKVLSAADYSKWVDGKRKEMAAKADDPSRVWKLEDLMVRGEKLYGANCAVCHKPDGKGAGPIKALDGSPIVQDADKGKQIAVLLNGAANGAMPSWKALSDTEIAAVITYTKNSWSNKTNQLVQPAEVQAVRGGKVLAVTASAAPAAAEAAKPAAAPAASGGLPASVFFASGVSTLDADAQKTMASVLEFLKANASSKVALSGYVDSSGNAAKNAELAKERAKAVRAALTAAGIAPERIEMRKPEQITAGTAAKDAARRVEIAVAG